MKNKNLKQRNITKNRRKGMAIEMAVLFMLVAVAMSGLAVSASMIRINKVDLAYEKMEQRMVLDRIGEDFCRDPNAYELPAELESVYDIDPDKTDTVLRVYPCGGTEPVLVVELSLVDGNYAVTKWSYGE